jgi:hypothetical protein
VWEAEDTQELTMCAPSREPILETPEEEPKEKAMLTDPDLYRYVARQREAELIEAANHERLVKSLRQRNRRRARDSRRHAAR